MRVSLYLRMPLKLDASVNQQYMSYSNILETACAWLLFVILLLLILDVFMFFSSKTTRSKYSPSSPVFLRTASVFPVKLARRLSLYQNLPRGVPCAWSHLAKCDNQRCIRFFRNSITIISRKIIKNIDILKRTTYRIKPKTN